MNTRNTLMCWFGLPLVCGVAAYLLAESTIFEPVAPPRLIAPSVIDFGPREVGTTARQEVRLENGGGQELVVSSISSSCGCSSLEAERNGMPIRLDSLRLGPGQVAKVYVRLAVRGNVGSEQRHILFLRSNDPKVSEFPLAVVVPRVQGGFQFVPSAVAFGTIAEGQKRVERVEIYDEAKRTRGVAHVESADPARIAVRFIPSTTPLTHDMVHKSARLIGFLEVEPLTDRPGTLAGEIRIHFSGEQREADRLAVTGEVRPAVEIVPSTIFLPRPSERGPLYSADVAVRSHGRETPHLELPRLPAGFTLVKLDRAAAPGEGWWRIAFDPKARMTSERVEIDLRVRLGAATQAMRLTVHLRSNHP